MPKSWSKKKRAEMAGHYHQQVPDCDNLQKAFLDTWKRDQLGNETGFNDATVAIIYAGKYWCQENEQPCIVLDMS